VVELLLSYSADVDIEYKWKTALQYAEREGHDDIVQLLKLYKRDQIKISTVLEIMLSFFPF